LDDPLELAADRIRGGLQARTQLAEYTFEIHHDGTDTLNPIPSKTIARLRREEGEFIDEKPKPGPTPGETESEGKAYCKDHPRGIVNLRSYSGDWYQQSCSELAARLQATSDPSYKIDPD
jgi:hypothetical protein